jgi:tetratricopeptide (TPR) repeat protein
MGLKNELASAIGNQALIYYKRGDLDTAIELHRQEANLFRDTGNMKGLELSIGNQAVIYMKTNPKRALSMLQEQENICRKRGYKDDLQMSIGNQATIYYQNDDLDKAMKLAKEKEKICNEIGLKSEIERAINIQKRILNVNSSLNKRERSKDMVNATAGDFTGPIYLNVQHKDNTMHTQYFFYGPSFRKIVDKIKQVKEIMNTISPPKSLFNKSKVKCFTCGKPYKKCRLVLGKDVYEIEKDELDAGQISPPCDIIVFPESLKIEIEHKNHPLMKKAPNEVVIFRNRSG